MLQYWIKDNVFFCRVICRGCYQHSWGEAAVGAELEEARMTELERESEIGLQEERQTLKKDDSTIVFFLHKDISIMQLCCMGNP